MPTNTSPPAAHAALRAALAEELRALRASFALTPAEVAAAARVSASTVSRLEAEQTELRTLETLGDLAAVFDRSIFQLLDGARLRIEGTKAPGRRVVVAVHLRVHEVEARAILDRYAPDWRHREAVRRREIRASLRDVLERHARKR